MTVLVVLVVLLALVVFGFKAAGDRGRLFVHAVLARVQRRVWLILGKIRKSHRLWDLVEGTGIVVYVGANGAGKSLAAVASLERVLDGVHWTCEELAHRHNSAVALHVGLCDVCVRRPVDPVFCEVARGLLDVHGQGERLVWSTCVILDGNVEHRLFRPLTDYRDMDQIEHADVLFDEVAGVSDSSDSAGLPVQVTNWIQQLRRRDVRLRVTTPAYARCSKPIRQIAQVVVDARSFFPDPAATERLWRPRRAMHYTAFDAREFEDYTSSTADRVKPLAHAALWRPGCWAESAYSTLGAVLALGHVTEGGMCAVCGGSRSRPRCGCPKELDDVPNEHLHVVENVSAGGSRTRRAEIRPEFAVSS
jgi:hypothetical protein